MQKIYDCTPSAQRFHESPARIKALWGPIGSGKSSAAFFEWMFMCAESEIPLLGAVVRSSYRELMDTSLRTYNNWFGPISEWRESDKTAVMTLPHPVTGEPQRHELLFRSIQKPSDTTKIQGLEPAFMFLEECVPSYQTSGIIGQGLPKAVFEIANSRLRQAGAARRTLVLTFNPPTPSHWCNQMFCAATPEDLAAMRADVVFQPPFENKPNLPENYYEDILRSMDPDMARRLVMGEIVVAWDGETVFPEAIRGVHVVPGNLEPTKGQPLVLGFDWGLTPATLVTEVLPNGQWRWLSEVQSFNSGAEAHLEAVREHLNTFYKGKAYRCWADPAGVQRNQTDEKTCFQLAANLGFKMMPGKQDWQSRKEAVKQRLGRMAGREPAVLISEEGCPIASEGILGGYRYPRSLGGEIGVRPIKNHFSHLLDCAEYIATREFQITQRGLHAPLPASAMRGLPAIDPYRPAAKPTPQTGSWMSNPAI